MQFNKVTYAQLLSDALDRVPDTVDKREGSIIYDALAPACYMLAAFYIELENYYKNSFVTTASGVYLDSKALEVGIERQQAIPAQIVTNFFTYQEQPLTVEIGSRYRCSDLGYTAIEQVGEGKYILECDEGGTAGNMPSGPIYCVEYNPNFNYASFESIYVEGTDTETDESLLKRLLQKVQEPSSSGNAADYLKWCLQVDGVGDAKVFPLWSGPGTVKLVVMSSSRDTPTEALLDQIRSHIEECRPIGAKVTIEGCQNVVINVSSNLTVDAGYSIERVSEDISKAVSDYINTLGFSSSIVSLSKITAIILAVKGVADCSNVKLNGNPSSIELEDNKVAKMGTYTVEG